MKQTDIVVVGAGIAGLTAAIYLKRANADFVVLEGDNIGGLLNKLGTIENYPSYPNITGKDLIKNLIEHVNKLGIEINKGFVQTILKEEGGFEVKSDVDIYKCKAVIVATGISMPKETIINQDKFVGLGVSYCATCDGSFFKGQDVAVVGNNDTALEESLYLSGLVKKLYLFNPSPLLVGDQNTINKLKELDNVEIVNDAKVTSINGDDFGVASITVNDKEYPVFGVFPYVGKKSSSQILGNLKPNSNGIYLLVDDKMQTNIEGLFAAGDITNKKLRQLVTAANDGAIAATNAIQYVKVGK